MTAEQRTLIEIQDVVGFEFECPRCESRVYIPIDRYDMIKSVCGNCREAWFQAQGAPSHVLLHELLEHLRDFRRQIQQPALKVRFQLEDNGPEREAK